MIGAHASIENRRWSELSKRGQKAAFDRNTILAGLCADIMRQLCPVDEGDMISTIRVMLVPEHGEAHVLVGGIPGRVTGKMVSYVQEVNYGTQYEEAQPFIEPAVQLAIDRARSVEVR
ncbi:MAG: hypothetical protein WCB68_12505, partial [Pyrinomonadaceae bacterium]